ncbi:hypothetical protein KQX54_007733 [Cotesia glomerata]|uniref:Uncharacterized protein n=1 Tax=Cotesia glomerata TaxID=32391 RepID=A0AAV7IY40_COTGL|nr:hypothetical protein KQX54_007733 [Cotesia glomerata]
MHVGGWPMVMNPDEWNQKNTWQKISHHSEMSDDKQFSLNKFIEFYENTATDLKLENEEKIKFSKLIQNVFDLINKDHDPMMNVTVRDQNYYANLSV